MHVSTDTDQDFKSKFFTTCVLCLIMFVTAVQFVFYFYWSQMPEE